MGMLRGSFEVSNRRDMSRWFGNMPATSPFASFEWNLGTSTTRHDKRRLVPTCDGKKRRSLGLSCVLSRGSRRRRCQINGNVTGLWRADLSRSRCNGIWALLCKYPLRCKRRSRSAKRAIIATVSCLSVRPSLTLVYRGRNVASLGK